ncbi:hypothetical protein BJ742DRAFT_829312 [Cladochytrium replicatum]|nr:hypothetical protein BJ742DRAFT_829312 [Cladochytrium replicatum]
MPSSVVPPYGVSVASVSPPKPPKYPVSTSTLTGSTISLAPAEIPLNPPPLPVSISPFSLPNGHLGPFLAYRSFSTNNATWSGSILILSSTPTDPPPTLSLSGDLGRVAKPPTPIVLACIANVTFYRFDLTLSTRRGKGTVRYEYTITIGPHVHRNTFHIAAADEDAWKWAHWSCAGFSVNVPRARRDALGKFTVWADLLKRHREIPFLVNVGGGDQVYADDVWRLPELVEWLAVKGKENRMKAEWTDTLEVDVTRFYLDLYAKEFSHPVMREVVGSIPLVCVADDHDIIDGFGSYPPYLQNSNMFRNLGRIALTFVSLFQHQTTPSLAPQDGFFFPTAPTPTGVPAYHHIRALGPTTLLAALDTRTERTTIQVLSPDSTSLLLTQLNSIAGSSPKLKHVVILTGVPMVYADLSAVDTAAGLVRSVKTGLNALTNNVQGVFGFVAEKVGVGKDGVGKTFKGLKSAVGKTGLMHSILNRFGEVELQDDLMDHWGHRNHEYERVNFIQALQSFASTHRVRISFVGGDVHVCGVGYLFSDSSRDTSPRTDSRFMVQIISSAIVNVPPPKAVATLVNRSAKATGRVDAQTLEGLHPVFGERGHVLGSRNWCAAEVLEGGEEVKFEIRAEVVAAGLQSEEDDDEEEGDGGARKDGEEVDVVDGVGFEAFEVLVPNLE